MPGGKRPFAAGKRLKGPKVQKRRHWGDASRFYWHRRRKGRGRSRAEPQQCRPFSPLEMPGGRIGRSSPLVNHLYCQCLRPYLAVALVPYVPSVPSIAAIGFAWLFVPLTSANSRQVTEATPFEGHFALLLAPETKGTRPALGEAPEVVSGRSRDPCRYGPGTLGMRVREPLA